MSEFVKKKTSHKEVCYHLEQVRGIEPPPQPWQGRILPLYYTCKMAVQTGLEPAISCVTGRHVNHYTTGPLLTAH